MLLSKHSQMPLDRGFFYNCAVTSIGALEWGALDLSEAIDDNTDVIVVKDGLVEFNGNLSGLGRVTHHVVGIPAGFQKVPESL